MSMAAQLFVPDRNAGSGLPPAAVTGTAYVWSGRIMPGADLSTHFAVLSEEERHRAATFRTAQLRDVYIAAHGTLRRLLSEAIGRPASQLAFHRNPWGKPELSGPHPKVHFNISHSNDRFLIALSRTAAIGVDIEKMKADAPYEIAEDISTPHERILFKPLSGAARKQAFYDLWTRKEAVAKAIGHGLSLDLQKIFFEFDHRGSILATVHAPLEPSQRSWKILPLPPIRGFAAALALHNDEMTITEIIFGECLQGPPIPTVNGMKSSSGGCAL